MLKLIRALGRAQASFRFRKFHLDTKNPEKAHARVWKEIRTEVKDSIFWRNRGFPSSLSEFRITDYETYRESIDRSFKTGVSELSGQPVIYWSESSGTSGKRKIFPITKKYLEQFQRTTAPFLHGVFGHFPGFLRQKVLYFAGMNPSERSPTGVEVGFISNFNYRKIPAFLLPGYGFPQEVFKDWSTFEKWAPAYALSQDLSAMIAITPSILQRFNEQISRNRSFYLDVIRGKILPPSGLPSIQGSNARIKRVQAAFDAPDFSFRDLWPTLDLVICWKGSGCALQLPALEGQLNGIDIVDMTYSATEGWVNVPFVNGIGGPIHPGAHVFEFIEQGRSIEEGNLIPLWQLEPGKNYEIFMTTAMGLIRYRLYDLIKCTGYFERSPIIEFVQKSLNEVILGMIRISETQILKAIELTGLRLTPESFFCPSESGDRLVLFSNSNPFPGPEQLSEVDQAIMAQNPYYGRDITRGWLKPLEARSLPIAIESNPLPATHAQSKPQWVRSRAPK